MILSLISQYSDYSAKTKSLELEDNYSTDRKNIEKAGKFVYSKSQELPKLTKFPQRISTDSNAIIKPQGSVLSTNQVETYKSHNNC